MIKFDSVTFNLAIKTELEKVSEVVRYKWPLKLFKDIISTIETGSRPAGGVGNITSGVLSLGGEHIDNSSGYLNLSEPKYVPVDYYEKVDKGKLQKEDLLICKDGALTGKVAIVRDELEDQKAMVNEHVYIIRCRNITLQNYLFVFLHSSIGQDLLRSNVTGSAQGGLNRSNLEKIKIPIPSVFIQNRIVNECQVIDKEANMAKEKIAELEEEIKGIVIGVKGKNTKLKDIAVSISTGPFGTMIHKDEYITNGKYCLINPQNIIDNKIRYDRISRISEKTAERLSVYKLQKDDIIIARRGDLSKCAIIMEEDKNCLCGTGAFFIHLDSSKVYPKFFLLLYTDDNLQSVILDKSHGLTMPNLNQSILNNLEIRLPSLSEQKKVIDKIGIIEGEIASLKAVCDGADIRKKAVLFRELIENDKKEDDIAFNDTITMSTPTEEYQPVEFESQMAAEPFERYKWSNFDKSICDFFGGGKTILVGCYKDKKYLDWVIANSIYTIRLGNTKGSMEESRELFNNTSLLVLYELGIPNILSVYKITSNKEMGKEELLTMNYPNKKPRKSYMTFSITPLEMDLTFLVEHHLIERLVELDSNNAKGTPLFIEP